MKILKLRIVPAVILTTLFLTSCGNIQTAETGVSETATIELNFDDSQLSDADKQAVYLAYLENMIKENILESLPEVENAAVMIACPADADIPAHSEDVASVSIILDLEDELTTYSPSELADVLARYVGNTATDTITIFDSEDNMLFPEVE